MPPINAIIVGKFDTYTIQLKAMTIGESEIEYHLTNEFFQLIGEEEIQKGDITVKVRVAKTSKQSELNFQLDGKVIIPCDRCLEEMEQPIHTTGHLIVRMGKEFKDDGDDIVVVPEEQGVINVSWFMYEFVALAIPVKHVHPYGMCNKNMSTKLREHIVDSDSLEDTVDIDDDNVIVPLEDNETTDPRWDALKKLK